MNDFVEFLHGIWCLNVTTARLEEWKTRIKTKRNVMVSWKRVVIRFNNWYEPNNWYSPILRYKSINAINDFNLNLITFIDNMPRTASNISFLEFQTVFSFIWQKCTLSPASKSSNSIKCNQKCIRFTLHTNRKLPLWTHSHIWHKHREQFVHIDW